MNYYIKGEHPKKWVREKLLELGVSEVNIPTLIHDGFIYCVVDEDCEFICSKAVQATIEASPDWEEVKPTEPKFKVGDIVMHGTGFYQVTGVKEQYGEWTYDIGGGFYIPEFHFTRPDNPTVRHKVKEAFAILNNKQPTTN